MQLAKDFDGEFLPWSPSPEVIEQEIEGLKAQIRMWKESYIQQGILDEETITCFELEIEELVYPYVRRLEEVCLITPEKAREILIYCKSELDDLRRIVTQRQLIGVGKIEFYYNSSVAPMEEFKTSIEKCFDLLKQLEAKWVKVKICDTRALSRREIDEKIKIAMNEAVVKPSIIGTNEAKPEWIGSELPLLFVYEKEADVIPKEVYPRREKKKLIGCEEAIQSIISKFESNF
ncbi:MAG: hypothetical protein QXJ68_03005 [Methanocellales archaeon]